MSTFNGEIKEIPGIAIDYFSSDVTVKAYFLSHCHEDHMKNIDDYNFLNSLKNRPNVYIYCSEVSSAILKVRTQSKFHLTQDIKEIFQNRIICLSMNKNGTLIQLDEHTISVILIPAGHCPGSVMFLFEVNDKKILYTGDFRINVGEIKKFNQFHHSTGEIKTIDKIYLDTTFLSEEYKTFPTRTESTKKILSCIKLWLNNDPSNVVILDLRAKFGYEDLLKSIYEEFKLKIHVDRLKYEHYSYFPQMDNILTLEKDSIRIHACLNNLRLSKFSDCIFDFSITLKILPTAMYWNEVNLSKKEDILDEKHKLYRVCYSTHASFEEIYDILKYLKIKKVNQIHPCVVENLFQINRSIENILKQIESSNQGNLTVDDDSFDKLNAKIKKFKSDSNISSERKNKFSDLIDLKL